MKRHSQQLDKIVISISVQTLQIATQQSQPLGHLYIDPEYLLLGILIEGRGLAALVLEQLGFNYKTLKQQLRNAISN